MAASAGQLEVRQGERKEGKEGEGEEEEEREGEQGEQQQAQQSEQEARAEAEEAEAHALASLGDPNADAFSFPAEATLPSYGSLRIPITFSPAALGECALPLLLTFEVCIPPEGKEEAEGSSSSSSSSAWSAARVARAAAQPPPLQCLVRGRGFPPPLYLEADTLDFRVCAVDKLYRGVVTVRNRGSIVGPVTVRLPPALADSGVVTILPPSAYVQAPLASAGGGGASGQAAHGSFSFHVLFRPSDAFLQHPERFGAGVNSRVPVGDEEGACPAALAAAPPLSLPLEIVSPIQALPLPFVLEARVTTPHLALSSPPSGLHFGSTAVGQAAALPLTLTNCSAMPQKYGFVGAPEGFSVSPGRGDGMGLLLPGESAELSAVFLPPRPGSFSATLRCLTSLNMTYSIPVTGTGLQPPLALSHSSLLLAATALGEEHTAGVLLSNSSAEALDFDVGMPYSGEEGGEGSSSSSSSSSSSLPASALPLTIHPSTGTLAPGASVRLAVRFAPTRDFYDASLARAAPAAEATKRAAVQAMELIGSGSGSGSGSSGSSGELPQECAPPTVETAWHAPIFWRQHIEYSVLQPEPTPPAAAAAAASAAAARPPPPLQHALLLHARTCAIPAALSASPQAHSFGAVPVGHTATLRVALRNASPVALTLAPEPLPPHSGFALLTPPPTLPPGGAGHITLAFSPTLHRVYVGTWRLGVVGEAPSVALALTGVGIAPQLALAPPGSGALDFGAVLCGDSVVRTVTLFNATPFAMPFAIEGPVAHFPGAPAAYSPTPVPTFAVCPRVGVVAGGGGAGAPHSHLHPPPAFSLLPPSGSALQGGCAPRTGCLPAAH